jgi:hypothetical protein
MRSWGRRVAPSTESNEHVDEPRRAAWDGLRGAAGAAVIQAERAGDVVEHRQVA